MADKLHCCVPGCETYVEFGGASRAMRQMLPDQRALLEMTAELTGWRRAVGDGWLCKEHAHHG